MPRLPPETIDRIIDFLHDDPDALQDCGLVCRAWAPTTRYHLFNEVELRAEEWELWERVIFESPRVGGYVRRLKVWLSSESDFTRLCAFAPFLDAVIHLRCLLQIPVGPQHASVLAALGPVTGLVIVCLTDNDPSGFSGIARFILSFRNAQDLLIRCFIPPAQITDEDINAMADAMSNLPLLRLWVPELCPTYARCLRRESINIQEFNITTVSVEDWADLPELLLSQFLSLKSINITVPIVARVPEEYADCIKALRSCSSLQTLRFTAPIAIFPLLRPIACSLSQPSLEAIHYELGIISHLVGHDNSAVVRMFGDFVSMLEDESFRPSVAVHIRLRLHFRTRDEEEPTLEAAISNRYLRCKLPRNVFLTYTVGAPAYRHQMDG